MALSKSNPEYIWVACNNGRIWHLNWTTGSGNSDPLTVSAKNVIDVTVDLIQVNEQPEDVLFVMEKETKTSAQIVAYDRKALDSQAGKKLCSCGGRPRKLQTAIGGRAVFAVGGSTIHIGQMKRPGKTRGLEQLEYDFYAFEANDHITCLDVRASPRLRREKKDVQSIDLVVGCWHGALFVYHDLLSQLPAGPSKVSRSTFKSQMLHWHRTCVHSVKWSRDGEISRLPYCPDHLLMKIRQLSCLRGRGKHTRPLANGYRQAGLSSTLVCVRGEHRRISFRFSICRAPRR